MFSESSPGCSAATLLPQHARGTFRKCSTKPLEQVADPPGKTLWHFCVTISKNYCTFKPISKYYLLQVAFVLFVTVVYPSLGLCITPDIDDVRNVVDDYPDPKFIADPRGRDIGDVAPADVLKTVFKKKAYKST